MRCAPLEVPVRSCESGHLLLLRESTTARLGSRHNHSCLRRRSAPTEAAALTSAAACCCRGKSREASSGLRSLSKLPIACLADRVFLLQTHKLVVLSWSLLLLLVVDFLLVLLRGASQQKSLRDACQRLQGVHDRAGRRDAADEEASSKRGKGNNTARTLSASTSGGAALRCRSTPGGESSNEESAAAKEAPLLLARPPSFSFSTFIAPWITLFRCAR